MTPQFNTPCYVRVDDKDKRKEVLEQTADFLLPINMSADSNYLFAFEGWLSRLYGRGLRGEKGIKELEAANFIDCGTNIDLFLALAGMRSDTDEGQWFTRDGRGFRRCNCANLLDDKTFSALWRKATAAEIVEHFKTKTK